MYIFQQLKNARLLLAYEGVQFTFPIDNRIVRQLLPAKSMDEPVDFRLVRAAKSRSTNFPCRLSADNEPRETLEQLRHCAS